MPPFREVRGYLGGLWLLVKGDDRGLARFDVSDEGLRRSFWAFAYALPAMALYWIYNRSVFVESLGDDAEPFVPFMAKMLLIEVITWGVPLFMLMLGAMIFRFRPQLRILVIVWNWLTMVTLYAIYGLALPMLWLPWPDDSTLGTALAIGFVVLIIALFIVAIAATWGILRVIVGSNALVRLALLFMTGVGGAMAEPLERFFGVYAPW